MGSNDSAGAAAEAPIVFATLAISKKVRAFVADHFAPLGLHPGQDRLLAELWREDGLAQSELIRRLRVEPPTVTNTVRRLERAGFVRRSTDASDRRVTRVFLTGEGRALENPVREVLRATEEVITAGLSDADRASLSAMLVRLAD